MKRLISLFFCIFTIAFLFLAPAFIASGVHKNVYTLRAEKQAAKSMKKKNSTNESGRVGDRPYARGRSYDPEHYGE